MCLGKLENYRWTGGSHTLINLRRKAIFNRSGVLIILESWANLWFIYSFFSLFCFWQRADWTYHWRCSWFLMKMKSSIKTNPFQQPLREIQKIKVMKALLFGFLWHCRLLFFITWRSKVQLELPAIENAQIYRIKVYESKRNSFSIFSYIQFLCSIKVFYISSNTMQHSLSCKYTYHVIAHPLCVCDFYYYISCRRNDWKTPKATERKRNIPWYHQRIITRTKNVRNYTMESSSKQRHKYNFFLFSVHFSFVCVCVWNKRRWIVCAKPMRRSHSRHTDI